jgi:hypothetical protein
MTWSTTRGTRSCGTRWASCRCRLSSRWRTTSSPACRTLIHRDIKPANILAVVESGRLVKVLLADFGESKQLTMTMTRAAGTVAGTPLYMAPEMYEEEDGKGPKADVFSAGVVLIEMGSGRQPNPGPQMRRRQHVPEEERRAEDVAAVHHPEISDLARRCIVDDEAARAAAPEIQRLCAAALRAQQPLESDAAGGRLAETTVQVKLLDGRRIAVRATARTSIAELIGRVCVELGQQRLVFAGRQLDPSRTVDDYNLLDGTQVHMLAAAGSGGAAGGSGSDEARAERQRREGVEDVNAQLRAENERLRAQNGELGAQAAAAAAAAEHSQQAMVRRITDLERELDAARLERAGGGGGGGGGMVRHVPREGGSPRRAVAAAQHPAGAVLKVENAGTAGCNGYYKQYGALGLFYRVACMLYVRRWDHPYCCVRHRDPQRQDAVLQGTPAAAPLLQSVRTQAPLEICRDLLFHNRETSANADASACGSGGR